MRRVRNHLKKQQRGFTLVELIITLFIGSLLLAWGVPEYRELKARRMVTDLTNDIVTFDLTFTEHEMWSAIPRGTLIVIYNGEERDTTLPPDDLDPSDGVIIVSSNDPRFFTLPSNGDGWGDTDRWTGPPSSQRQDTP